MSVDYMNASTADGRMVVEWLEERRELPETMAPLGETVMRRIQSWRAGHRADFWAVDKVLTRLGLHVSMLPDEVWILDRGCHLVAPEIRSTKVVREWKPRFCRECGDEIPRKARSRESYETAAFCSLDCTKKGKGGLRGNPQMFFREKGAA